MKKDTKPEEKNKKSLTNAKKKRMASGLLQSLTEAVAMKSGKLQGRSTQISKDNRD